MNKLPAYPISACERGIDDNSLPPENLAHSVSTLYVIKAAICIVMFNVCLSSFGYICYKFVNDLQDEQRIQVTDGLCCLAGMTVIVWLIRCGDLSKNNSNLYYI
ncbi:uncharacterized protein LOC116805982 [Drosophila grimshawi]|uniref:uncharacterized protein LOC116805982 n=1 Tax=Drosophila grimshawi TaxID=7222 RepID=UPI000C86E54E|nr:uncharacterized protein LOC116805982 [Drosophila grimshawi]